MHRLALVLITLLGLALRAGRIEWQPLWWDEGYSVFFATEPIGRMVALTARDIHPPAYYVALHGWLSLLSSTGPAALRSFSIMAGTVAIPLVGTLAYRLSDRRSVAAACAAFLLALDPLHIYYSQEVRMYSLAATVALTSSYCLVNWVALTRAGRPSISWLAAYGVCTLILVHTLYYTAPLIAVQFLWAVWLVRGRRRALTQLAISIAIVALLSFPWLWYAGPKLVAYVDNKVQSDQDASLPFIEYLLRHAIAFSAGHVVPLQYASLIVVAAGLLALTPLIFARQACFGLHSSGTRFTLAEAVTFLVLTAAAAILFGFGMNIRFPFFPEGGERLLLFVVPYVLALIALGIACSRLPSYANALLISPLLVVFVLGIDWYYSYPRHTEQDYRAIVRTVEQRGSANDTALALFPWQVGYWRAYGQRDDAGSLYAPQPAPVGQETLEWNAAVADRLAQDLAGGVLWFPEPLSLGSTLPMEIEAYLRTHALNVEDQWQTAATRLTAWSAPSEELSLTPLHADFGPLTLVGYALAPESAPSDNSVIEVALAWEQATEAPDAQVVLKLVDPNGQVAAERSYRSPGSLDQFDGGQSGDSTDRLGWLVPAGLPPGDYEVKLAVLGEDGEAHPAHDAAGKSGDSLTLDVIRVTPPDEPVAAVRVPIEQLADTKEQSGDIRILGVSGLGDKPSALAGSDLSFQVAIQSLVDAPNRYDLFLELRSDRGESAPPWQGWPIENYPTSQWPKDAIVLIPVQLELPATITGDTYRLVAALVDHADDARLPDVDLARVEVSSRPGQYDEPPIAHRLDIPVQFGTHARLLGYDFAETEAGDGRQIDLTLYWEALQPLRPQHHIFVHVEDGAGTTIAQQDGQPVTEQGAAPTGSWRAGEYVVTQHTLRMPVGFPSSFESDLPVEVGLYNPRDGVRLPTFVDDEAMGDSAQLLLGSP